MRRLADVDRSIRCLAFMSFQGATVTGHWLILEAVPTSDSDRALEELGENAHEVAVQSTH